MRLLLQSNRTLWFDDLASFLLGAFVFRMANVCAQIRQRLGLQKQALSFLFENIVRRLVFVVRQECVRGMVEDVGLRSLSKLLVEVVLLEARSRLPSLTLSCLQSAWTYFC